MLVGCCAEQACSENEFKCLKVFQCIPIETMFDGKVDCLDGTDESGEGDYICC